MNSKALVKKLSLSKDGFERISQAIKSAEEKTSGEIVLALASESSDYSFWELFAAIIASLALCICALPFADEALAFYQQRDWSVDDWALPALYLFSGFFLILLLFVLFNLILPLDRLVIPKAIKDKAVSDRALRAFSELSLYSTRERTGVLIFVSYLERQVRILADEGISKKVGGGLWKIIASGLADEIGNGNAVAAFCDAVQKCGELLAQYFPADKDDNPNELSDGVVILER